MGYRALSFGAAQEVLRARAAGEPPEFARCVTVKRGDVVFDFSVVRHEAMVVRARFGTPIPASEMTWFERELGVAIHRSIRLSDADDPDFWRWMALDLLYELTVDRHGAPQDGAARANFGLGGRPECFPYRAWLRAEIGHEPDVSERDAYRLALRGDQDFWRSHLIRVRFPFHRPLAHALIEFQYPDDSDRPVLKVGADKSDGIRMLAKRLGRAQANLAFPLLSKEQCACLVRRLAHGLSKADGTRYTATG